MFLNARTWYYTVLLLSTQQVSRKLKECIERPFKGASQLNVKKRM